MSRNSSAVHGGGSGGRSNANVLPHHRRLFHSHSHSTIADDHLAMMDLFSRNNRRLPSSDDSSSSSDVSVRLRRLSLGSAKQPKPGFDDLLSSIDGGKNDYDWLLTPPGTPLFPSSNGSESQPASVAPRKSSLIRSVSTTKASRLSVSESESIHPSRPARSNSVTRPAVSSTQYSTLSNKSASILNTSSASVSSYIRPSTPTPRASSSSRPSTPTPRASSSSRPSTPTSRSTPSRSSTPSRVRPAPTSSSIDRSRPSINSRPSTPTSRPQLPANLNSPVTRPLSRPSTPTRRNSAPSMSQSTGLTTSASRSLSNGYKPTPVSRPSSPGPRVRPPPQTMVLPDFPLETPPNLRTTLPDRPLSAGRSRPGSTLTVKGNMESQSSTMPRRQSSPIITRGRLSEPNGRGRVHAGVQAVDNLEPRKASHVLESSARKPVKASIDSAGFGRTISKKSLDMAIRHMDIRNGTNGTRPLTGSTLFPQSIRPANYKIQPGRATSGPASVDGNLPVNNISVISENGKYANRYSENVNLENKYPIPSKVFETDMYESSRYDAILQKEDLKNTNWLHNADDKSDQGPVFDYGFEHLPEPFGPV